VAKGKVVQVIGTVVDVEFPAGQLPALYNALEINTEQGKIVLEVESHMPNDWVRCVSLSPTEGLERGIDAVDTGSAVKVPVGKGTLGRLFNVFRPAKNGVSTEPHPALRNSPEQHRPSRRVLKLWT
jgi:F-type H+-transporting ATPase subunit beta